MRAFVLRALSVVFALTWLAVAGLGVAELITSWGADRPVALQAGWGLFTVLLVALPLLLVGFMPRLVPVALTLLVLAVAAMVLGAVATLEWWLLVFAAGAGLQTYVLLRVGRRLREAAIPATRPRLVGVVPMLVAVVGLGAWLVYGVHMVAESYDEGAVYDVTLGVDHYAVLAALAVVVGVLGLLAAARPVDDRLMGWTAGLVAAGLGTLSVIRPEEPGGLGRAGGTLAVAWGIAVWAMVAPRVHHEVEGGAGLVSLSAVHEV